MSERSIYSLKVNYVDRAAIDASVTPDGKWEWLIDISNDYDPPERWTGMPDYESHQEAAAAGLAFVVDYFADPERSEEPVESYQLTFMNPVIDVAVAQEEGGQWRFNVKCVEDNLEGRYIGEGVSSRYYETRGQALGAGVFYGRWFTDRVGAPPQQILVTGETRLRRSDEPPLVE